jgi:hypothetical protein
MANGDLVNIMGLPNRELTVPQVNGLPTQQRMSRYGEQLMQLTDPRQSADEGSYFVATNPTLGSAITGTAAPTAFSATVALLSLYNSLTATSAPAKRVYLEWIALEVRAAGTNGTSFQFAMSIDSGNRFGSGGTPLPAVNPNMDSGFASISTINFGALTASAASAAVRRVKHGQIRPAIKVIGDVYLFTFGQPTVSPSGADIGGTNVQLIPVHCPPVILGPNQSFLLHEIAPSQSVAATYEISLGLRER